MVWQRASKVPSPSKQQKNFTKDKTRGLSSVMATASALGNASLLEGFFESGAFCQTPHQQQITVRIVGAEPLPVFLKQTFTRCVITAAMQLLDPLPHLRQARLQQPQRIAG